MNVVETKTTVGLGTFADAISYKTEYRPRKGKETLYANKVPKVIWLVDGASMQSPPRLHAAKCDRYAFAALPCRTVHANGSHNPIERSKLRSHLASDQ